MRQFKYSERSEDSELREDVQWGISTVRMDEPGYKFSSENLFNRVKLKSEKLTKGKEREHK